MEKLDIEELTKNSKIITWEEWEKENIATDFQTVEDEETRKKLADKYPLRQINEDDLFFTYEIEDDGVNTTARLSDYDWMSYTYDTRFPTKEIGTLSVRFEYFGTTTSWMEIRQYIPAYLSGMDINYVICHEYEFPTTIFEKYMEQDFLARIENMHNSDYAYSPDKTMLEWYNEIITTGRKVECKQKIEEHFEWESVRIPKKEKKNRLSIVITEEEKKDET